MIACKGLMNLSAVLVNNTADGVNKVIMDCLTSLTKLDVGFLSSFAAEVIQNLSTLPTARQKIADEGAIDIINTLIRSDANARTMKAAAISLCNLSQLKSCRQEMLEMGVIEVLTKMLRTDNAETVYLCTLALSNLTAQSELRKVVAKEASSEREWSHSRCRKGILRHRRAQEGNPSEGRRVPRCGKAIR